MFTLADAIVETMDSGPPIFTTFGFACGLFPSAFAPERLPSNDTFTSNCFCIYFSTESGSIWSPPLKVIECLYLVHPISTFTLALFVSSLSTMIFARSTFA